MEKTPAQHHNEWMLANTRNGETLYRALEKALSVKERAEFMDKLNNLLACSHEDQLKHCGLDIIGVLDAALQRSAREYSRIESARLAYEKFCKANPATPHRLWGIAA